MATADRASERVDVIIIGAGTAGLSALRQVRRQTESFVVINEGSWGTTCARVGCMPSKAIIEAANAFHRRHAFPAFGIEGSEDLRVNVPEVMARVRKLRDGFTRGPESTPRELGDRAIHGRARLVAPDEVEVEGRRIRARSIILAPGSRPVVPPAWRGFAPRLLTTDTLFEQGDLPRRMAVVGLGAIGVEMAQALARLGVEVEGFEALDTLAGLTDPAVVAALEDALRQEFPVHTGSPAELSEADGRIAVSGGGGTFVADAVLAALGRTSNADTLGLADLDLAAHGVQMNDKGLPRVDETTLQVGDLPLFLAGDANARLALLHEAADDGFIAGRNALADTPARFCRRTPLVIAFTSPGVARVGTRFADLDPGSAVVGSFDFSRQARARMAERARGLLRIYAERGSGRLLGAEMCIPDAEHMAHLLALAMQQELTVHDLLGMPFYHPVLEEGLRSALRDLARQVETRAPGDSDLADCPALGMPALD